MEKEKKRVYTFQIQIDRNEYPKLRRFVNQQNFVKVGKVFDSIEFGKDFKKVSIVSNNLRHIFLFGRLYEKEFKNFN